MRTWLRRASFRSRITILAAAAVGLSVAFAALVSYLVVSRELNNQVTNQLNSDVNIVSDQLDGGPFSNVAFAQRALQRITNGGDLLQVVSASGLVYPPPGTTTASGMPVLTLPVSAEARRVATTGASVFGTRTVDGRTYRTYTVGTLNGYRVSVGNASVAIQVAHPINDILHTKSELRLVLLLVGLAGVGVAVALGYAVGRVTIRPVERLTGAAEHVAATQDLDATIQDDGDDELGRLAHAFNAMLAALRSSRQQQAQLVSDAGHELRTPLTSLRTNIEVLLRARDLPEEDRTELLGDVRAQLEELTTLIGDIVELARQEETQPEPTEIRLDTLVEHAVERARRRALSVSFDVRLDAGSVRAQPALLERAVLNVLDNAAKWSPPGGRVDVVLQRLDRWVLDVRDHGPGIAPSDLPFVFDRFYRAPTARSLPGSGLGLAIVAQVVGAHGGQVTPYLPPDGGTLMRIELPIVAESEASQEAAGADDRLLDRPGADVPSPDASVPSASTR